MNGLALLEWLAWLGALGWLALAAVTLYGLTQRKPLLAAHGSSLEGADAPLVSALIPARNEAHRILAQSVRSVLAQDYRRLEIIVINDRSTDSTEAILRSIAETDERLSVINGVGPPADWLGKPYALQQAFDISHGEWVLTIDADMVLEKEAVRVALGHALAGNYDVLTLMPRLETGSFWERVFTPVWVFVLLGAYPFAIINHPGINHAIAFGGFSLIRRGALARVGGFAAVRADIIEDVRLAVLLKSSGARFRIEHAPNLVRTRMQTSFREIWNYLSRSMFAGLGYSRALAALSILSGYTFAVAPVFFAASYAVMMAAGATGEWSRLFIPSLIIWATQVGILALICKSCDIPVGYALTTPLGFSLFYNALLSSTSDIVRGEGVVWKDRKVYQRAGVGLPVRRGDAPPTPPAVDEP